MKLLFFQGKRKKEQYRTSTCIQKYKDTEKHTNAHKGGWEGWEGGVEEGKEDNYFEAREKLFFSFFFLGGKKTLPGNRGHERSVRTRPRQRKKYQGLCAQL
jgi:hypothetical protein